MAIIPVRCHVSGATVTRVCDFEGNVVQLICPEYDAATKQCRLMERASSGGPLSTLVERVAEGELDRRGTRCELA